MRLRITHWLSATRRHRGLTATTTPNTPPPTAPPIDHERVGQVGDVLQSCYTQEDEALDDHLTALMLRLTVDAVPPPAPRRR